MKRVVVVEDQVILREFIIRLVEASPMLELVGQTGDGLDGYALIAKLKPDMAILDIMLPGLNGVGIMKKIRQEMPEVRVLGFSAFPNRILVRQMLELGAGGLVQKSESLQTLETAIETVAQGQTYFSPHVSDILREMMLHPEQANHPDDLSTREREVLQLVAESYSNKQIAEKLGISVKTAETHRNRIISKLDIHDSAGLTRFAIANGLVDPNP
ncbi:response regulator [Cerasicoccus fimbriatus]|uniref:response regulator n=1 Tax=Cerasicoccus fimbriatus TaxID=3014554 RepID=UPI0022B45E2F|nr:response regulator transcription factor [Cerasicoccus sp. TK19100]